MPVLMYCWIDVSLPRRSSFTCRYCNRSYGLRTTMATLLKEAPSNLQCSNYALEFKRFRIFLFKMNILYITQVAVLLNTGRYFKGVFYIHSIRRSPLGLIHSHTPYVNIACAHSFLQISVYVYYSIITKVSRI